MRNRPTLSLSLLTATFIMAGLGGAQATSGNGTPAHTPAVQFMVGDVTDKRGTETFFKGLEIELKLIGDFSRARYYGAPIITLAKDSTGRDLLKTEDAQHALWSVKKLDNGQDGFKVEAKLQSPARAATVVALGGSVPVYSPESDPAATHVIKDLATQYGKSIPLGNSGAKIMVIDSTIAQSLKEKEEAEAAARKKEGNLGEQMGNMMGEALSQMFGGGGRVDKDELLYTLDDKDNKIIGLELLDAAGNPLKTRGSSMQTNKGITRYSVRYEGLDSPGLGLRVITATPASTLLIPFTLKDVPLP
jgi:hypothetical protein